MLVRAISVSNLYGHTDSFVELPERGLVVVTGDNGAGKTGLFVEAIATALWGKTIRGGLPWDEIGCSSVAVTVGDLNVRRARKKGKSRLDWAPVVGTPADRASRTVEALGGAVPWAGCDVYATATAAQAVLDEALECSFESWSRTHLLSSADAAHFSTATDAQRKRLVESLLGLDRFDGALEVCRRERRNAQEIVEQQRAAVRYQEARVVKATEAAAAARRHVEATVKQRVRWEGPAPTRERLERVSKVLTTISQELTTARAMVQFARDERMARTNEYQLAKKRLQMVLSEACPMCERPFEGAERLQEEARSAVARAEAAIKVATDKEMNALRLCDGLIDEEREASQARLTVERETAMTEARYTESLQWSKMLDLARQVMTKADEDQDREMLDARAKGERLSAAERDERLRWHAEAVLGMKGVRAHLLGGVLRGIGAAATSYVERLGRSYAIELSATEGTLELHIDGAGAGKGYAAMSAGERRRVDVALLLALGDASAAARAVPRGTLCLDEALDALDDAGVHAAANLLGDLARERPIVLITHNAALAQALKATKRYHVKAGQVEEH